MDHHLPVLQIVVPLLAAPLCVLIKARRRVLAIDDRRLLADVRHGLAAVVPGFGAGGR